MKNNILIPPFPAKQGDLWGFVGINGEWIVPAQYEAVLPYNPNGIAVVMSKNRIKFIDLHGRATDHSNIDAVCISECHGNTIAERQGKWFVINPLGKKLSTGKYDFIYPFSKDHIAVVVKNGRFGYISENGDILINPCYFDATAFRNGVAAVKTSRYWRLINLAGNYISDQDFDEIHDFSECGLAAACQNNCYGYIDRNGDFLIPQIYKDVSDFYPSKVAWVRNAAGWRLIDSSGKYLCDEIFDAYQDSDYCASNMFSVQHNGLWGVLDDSGKLRVEPQFSKPLQILKQGFFVEEKQGFRYLSAEGKSTTIVVSSYIADSGKHPVVFGGGLQFKYGYINTDTLSLIDIKYDYARPFNDEGFAEVVYHGENYVINAYGEHVQPPANMVLVYDILRKSGADCLVTDPHEITRSAGKYGKYELIGDINKPYHLVFRTNIAKEK